MNFSPLWQSSKTGCWHIKSHSYAELLEERKRWYPNNKKIVPKDIRITSTSCYWWFIGDGYAVDYGIMLCAESFTNKDKKYLIDKLKENSFDAHIVNSNKRKRIKGNSAKLFLDCLQENNTIADQYKNKWKNGKRMPNTIPILFS